VHLVILCVCLGCALVGSTLANLVAYYWVSGRGELAEDRAKTWLWLPVVVGIAASFALCTQFDLLFPQAHPDVQLWVILDAVVVLVTIAGVHCTFSHAIHRSAQTEKDAV
jgi:hypothetical protein